MLPDKDAIDEVIGELEHAKWSVRSVEGDARQLEGPAYDQQLQQDASSRLGFNVRQRCMPRKAPVRGRGDRLGGHGRPHHYMDIRIPRELAPTLMPKRASLSAQLGAAYSPPEPE